MATINLGNLTFTHKGDYAGGTAYVKNANNNADHTQFRKIFKL